MNIQEFLRSRIFKSKEVTGEIVPSVQQSFLNQLQVLPGNDNARFAVPIEYEPSRDYNSRWGYGKKFLEPFEKICERDSDNIIKIFSELNSLKNKFQAIPVHFDHHKLPDPGWVGGAIR